MRETADVRPPEESTIPLYSRQGLSALRDGRGSGGSQRSEGVLLAQFNPGLWPGQGRVMRLESIALIRTQSNTQSSTP